MPRTVRAACAAGLMVSALLATPAPAAAHAPARPDLTGEDVIAESGSDTAATAGGIAKVNQLDRSSSGLTVLAWTMHNAGEANVTLTGNVVGRTYLYAHDPFSGVTLLDEERQVRHHPMMDEDSRCLCSAGFGRSRDFISMVGAGRFVTYHSTFLLAEDVDEVTVEIPGFEPVTGVPVSDL